MNDHPIQSASEHDCCAASSSAHSQQAQTSDRSALGSSLGAVGTAVLASACCWLPLLLLSFGVTAGGVAGFFESVRPYFLAAAVLFLGTGFYFAYFRKPVCRPGDACAVPNTKLQRFNRVLLWVATAFVIAFALFPYYSPALVRAFAVPPAATSAGSAVAGTTAAPTTTRVFPIEGMTCPACAATLEVRLAKLPGVTAAHVSYPDASATIRSASGEPADGDIHAAVERAGFKIPDRHERP